MRDGCSSVLVGKDIPKGGRVTVAGSLTAQTAVEILFTKDFTGTLAIDNVNLKSLRNEPCISLVSGSDVILEIIGDNRFEGGGIRVPDGSRLEIIGSGAVAINLDDSDYFGIGNDMGSQNGDIVFSHNSMIYIEANGQCGVGIGSGRGGGRITVNSGKYLISQKGGYGVSIGTLNELAKLDIQNCDLETKLSAAKGTCLGSLHGRADIHLWLSSFRCFAGGLTVAAIGTADGDSASVRIDNANVSLDVRADELTAIGALKGETTVDISKASVLVQAGGIKALAFGGIDKHTSLAVNNADVGVTLTSELDVTTSATEEDIHFNGGRCILTVNGKTAEFG